MNPERRLSLLSCYFDVSHGGYYIGETEEEEVEHRRHFVLQCYPKDAFYGVIDGFTESDKFKNCKGCIEARSKTMMHKEAV